MPDNRILGQDCIMRLIKDNSIVAEITDIQEFSFEYDRTLTEDGYAGEKSNRYGEVYNGVKGDASGHISDPAFIDFADQLNLRSQRKVPGFRVDVIGVFAFPNGVNKKMLLSDLSFGSIPMRNGGRGSYVSFSLTYACSTAKVI